ncbi:MAG: helix-turn-helix domain-containing protein, partial [Comamonas sp.]
QPATNSAAGSGFGAQVNNDAFSPAASQVVQAASSAQAAAPSLQVYTPEQAAQLLGVDMADVLSELEAGNLKGRKIGVNWRIAQTALDAFLRGE